MSSFFETVYNHAYYAGAVLLVASFYSFVFWVVWPRKSERQKDKG